ncbi:MAG: hypothetical protein DFNUSKGM_001813 [Candidatus Fervidibacter sacchari]
MLLPLQYYRNCDERIEVDWDGANHAVPKMATSGDRRLVSSSEVQVTTEPKISA